MRKSESKSFKVAAKNAEQNDPDEVEIRVTALDGNSGGELAIRLLQLFGPSLLGVITAMETDDMAKVVESGQALFTKLTPAEFTAIRRQLLTGAQAMELGEFADVNDQFVKERFAGHVGSLIAVLALALKVNYANFFEDLGVSKERMAKLTAKVQASKTVTGVSGPRGA